MAQDSVAGGGVAKRGVATAAGPGDPAVLPANGSGHLAGGASGSGRGAEPAVMSARDVIRTGSVSLVSGHVDRALEGIGRLMSRYGGYVSQERTTHDRAGHVVRSTLELRVPSPDFDTVLADLAHLGRERSAHQQSQDVTTEVIDVDSRVRTQRASTARLRRLMRTASTVDDTIAVESEIATREATLESLEAQQAYLRDQTTMSTLTVHLASPHATAAGRPGQSGFVGGLASGWHALTMLLAGVATLLGAVLPFAAVAALVGVPLWLALRASARRRQARQAPGPPAPDSPTP